MTGALEPILVLSLGRSGSTYLMSVLGTSPHILFDKEYPFERRYLTYWLQACRVIGMASDQRFNYAEADVNSIGPIPFQPGVFLDREAFAGELLPAGWEVFSKNVIAATGVSEARYYAEKVPFHIVKSLDGRIPYRFISLLRDPRDVFLSIKRFNEKRKKKAFGWREGQSEQEYAVQFLPNAKMAFNSARRAERATNGLFVTYEDLILKPDDSYARIARFLGTTISSPVGETMFQVHGTSTSPSESVGSWRSQLNPGVADLLSRGLEAELREFRYDS